MPNVAGVLKAEMSRVARKELRSEIDPLRKQLAAQRSAIAALKKQLQTAQRAIKMASRGGKSLPVLRDVEDASVHPAIRFNAKGLAKHRQRLGISAADMARLLGVSPLSVYKWESGKTRPRSAQLQAIGAIRKLGKKEARRRLDELAAPARPSRKAA